MEFERLKNRKVIIIAIIVILIILGLTLPRMYCVGKIFSPIGSARCYANFADWHNDPNVCTKAQYSDECFTWLTNVFYESSNDCKNLKEFTFSGDSYIYGISEGDSVEESCLRHWNQSR